MTASQRAKQKCATKENKPTKESQSANCCMVAPWMVVEDGRSYQLKVTQVKQQKRLDKTVDISDNLEPSNKKNGKYELHIVAPPADKEGKVTYKKITSKHTFLKKECDLKMLVKSKTQEKSIVEGGSFEIDTNGNIKGAMKGNCNTEDHSEYIPTAEPNACVTGKDLNSELKQIEEEIEHYKNYTAAGTLADQVYGRNLSDKQIAMERYFAECRMEVAQIKKDMLLNKLPSENEFTFVSLLSDLFKPLKYETLSLVPTGSNKCVSQPSVNLFIHPNFQINGTASFSVAEQYKLRDWGKERIEINGNDKKASLSLDITQGSHKYIFTHVSEFKAPRQRPKNVTIKDSSSLFGPLAETVSKIYEVSAAANKLSKNRNKRGSNSFDPGMTKFSLTGTDVRLAEDAKSHEVYWKGKVDIGLTFFDGANLTLDLLPYVIGLGGPIATLIEKALRTGGESLSKYTGISADIKLELVVKGSASGTVKLDFKDKETIASTGQIKGNIGFTVKGLVEAGLDAFGVEAGAGAGFSSGAYGTPKDSGLQGAVSDGLKDASYKNAGGATELKCELSLKQAKQGKMPTFDGDIKTTGLAIYYASYTYVRKTRDDNTRQNTGGEGIKKKKLNTKHTTKLEYNAKDRIPLVEPFSFTESIKKHIG
jgi:hypothetical protein